ncbi:tetratricopeptide repeat protein [Exilibacterium tricleocarpae]|uniref:Tetratricopeptide repeat protein n=1 Tax=Exilibacterium tricleocarpae TaxID=2591008 RepID=A0A545SRS4_9GAMM|nr:tetratricopeptide repeat protein [Exilibacterium tricleocarpae]TQV67657.1 tetratricopeptide repeat protein [Exilibacterium tricleocarpae]
MNTDIMADNNYAEYLSGKLKTDIADIQRSLRKFEGKDELAALHYKSELLKRSRDSEEPLSILNTLVALDPNWLSLCKLARLHILMGNYREAVKASSLALTYRENDSTAVQLKAAALALENKPAEALEVISLAPGGYNNSLLKGIADSAVNMKSIKRDVTRLIRKEIENNKIPQELDLNSTSNWKANWRKKAPLIVDKLEVPVPPELIVGAMECTPFNALTDRVLLTGSFAEGCANNGSNIDIYVLTDSHKTDVHKYSQYLRRSIDIQYFGVDYIENLSTSVDINEEIPEDWTGHEGNTYVLNILHRLANAIPLNNPPFSIVDWPLVEPEDLNQGGAITHLKNTRNLWQDAAGALAKGDDSQAAFAAEIGLWFAIDALGCLEGLTNPLPKWRLRKAEQLQGLYPGFDQAKECMLSNRKPFQDAEHIVVKLADSLYQITHKLVYGRYCDKPPPQATFERVEVVSSGEIKIDIRAPI